MLRLRTTLLSFASVVLVSCRMVHVPPDIQVLSPSEFDVILPSELNETAHQIRIGINKKIGFGLEEADYSKKSEGRVIRFSEKDLNLTKGDVIYFSLIFFDDDFNSHGQTGSHVFDGVYKNSSGKTKREVKEYSSEEHFENSNEEKASQSSDSTELDHDRHLRNDHRPHGHHGYHGPPHDHFSRNGPPHGHFDPHFNPHHPRGYGAWKGHGYNHRDQFGNNGPWDGHSDDDDCESSENHPKYPGGDHGSDKRRPWGGGHTDNPYSDRDNGYDNPYGSNKPNKGNDFGNNNWNLGSNEKNDNNKNNKGTDNPNAEIFTTKKPSSTTQRTTTVPDIDIRFGADNR